MIFFTIIPSDDAHAKNVISRWASAEDYSQAELHQNEARRHDYLLTRSGIRALLFHITQDSHWRFFAETSGRPYVKNKADRPAPYISLSHTKGLVACAVSEICPVGIDIEHWRCRDFNALASYAFGPLEKREVDSGGISSFYKLWTLKEASAKLSGEGLSTVLGSKDAFSGLKEEGFIKRSGEHFYSFSPLENYSLTIAATASNSQTAVTFSQIFLKNIAA